MERVETPRLVQAWRAHGGEVACLDACGARLVTGGGGALRLWVWRAGAGYEAAGDAAAAHRMGVTGVRWAAGGALLASCGVDGALRVWAAGAGGLAARRLLAAGGAAAARALCWAGGRLVAGHDDGAVCVWAVAEARLLARLVPLEGAVHAMCTPARDSLLLVACTTGVLKVFDLDEVSRGGTEQGAGPAPLLVDSCAHDLGALCAAASECGARAATGGHDAVVRVWRRDGAGRGRGLRAGERLAGHGAAVTALRWARGLLGSAALDRSARLWAPPPPPAPPDAPLVCLHVVHAHPRYLTCLALAHDLRFLITGSNDKSVRVWALRGLALDDALAPACSGMPHFALGDLQGISPLDDDDLLELDAVGERGAAEEGEGEGQGGAWPTWSARAHGGAVNCLVARGDLLASASSDGTVVVWRLAGGALLELHRLEAHQYPAQCVAWGAPPLLLSAGLDGRAFLWDVEAGCRLRALVPPGLGGEAGGGGVRGAAVSPHHPPLLLLATDDGLAPVWSLAEDDPTPIHVYLAGEAVGAAWCCAWAGGGGAAAALGGAGGELRLLAPPPPHALPRQLAIVAEAHDLGVTSCQFAPSAEAAGYGAGEAGGAARHVLATAGGDSQVKLWIVDIEEEGVGSGARIQLARRVAAHGGAAASAAWGAGRAAGLLASAGADEWARVWAAPGGEQLAAAPAPRDSGGALAAALLAPEPGDGVYLALGTLQGHVALWRLRAPAGAGVGTGDAAGEAEAALAPRWWSAAGVQNWLKEYVTRVPGRAWAGEEEAGVLAAARGAGWRGAALLDKPLAELMRDCGFEFAESDDEESEEAALASSDEEEPPRARLRRELRWLRRAPPTPQQEDSAPAGLRCALSHLVLREPARAADGITYERATASHWLLAAEGAVSAVSGRRMRSARLLPNYGVRRALRRYLRGEPPPAPDQSDQPDQPEQPDQPDQPDPPDPPEEPDDPDTADLLGLDDA